MISECIVTDGYFIWFYVGAVGISSAFTQIALVGKKGRIGVIPPLYIPLPWKEIMLLDKEDARSLPIGFPTLRRLYGTS